VPAGRGIAYRPRRPSLVQRLGPAELWWLHHHEQLTVTELAIRLQTNTEGGGGPAQRGRARRTPPRRLAPPKRPSRLPPPDLKLIEQTFAVAACPPATETPATRLPRTTSPRGVGVGRHPGWPVPQDANSLRYLYRTLRLGLVEVADRLHVRIRAAQGGAPRRSGSVATRAGRAPATGRCELEKLYVDEDWSVDAIGSISG
jgi:hypothetical protein